MKKLLLLLVLTAACGLGAAAQKFALVDMEYILKNYPSYEMANEQLNQLSQRWQKEVEAASQEADGMYKQYLSDKVFLTEEQVKKETARCLGCGASVVDENRCIGCGVCTTKCEFDAIHLYRENPECSTMRRVKISSNIFFPTAQSRR